jgi:crotonobetainyl-CoA:carnitine CoA-transferase CaiB-like acyl-CoA transferase
VLLTSHRPSALARLGLAWADLERRYTRLVQVAIVGHAEPDQELPGHDLTYLASFGLVSPPTLPQTLAADLGGAERAVTAAVALLLGRERGTAERYAEVALADAAETFALPWTHGLTQPGGVLGGGLPFYGLYEAKGGWIAVAALEPRFRERLVAELGVAEPSHEAFREAFAGRTPAAWEAWAAEHDLPIAAVAATIPRT